MRTHSDRVTKFKRVADILNAHPPRVHFMQSKIYDQFTKAHSPTDSDFMLMKHYLRLIEKAGYIHRDGRGRDAWVVREKRIPLLKIQIEAVEVKADVKVVHVRKAS